MHSASVRRLTALQDLWGRICFMICFLWVYRMAYIQDQIRQARETRNFTQGDLGKRIGQPQSSISRIERGGDLRVSTLLELTRVLDLEPMLIPKRLVPAVRALIEHTADGGHSKAPTESSPPLVGGVPEDAEEENS